MFDVENKKALQPMWMYTYRGPFHLHHYTFGGRICPSFAFFLSSKGYNLQLQGQVEVVCF